MENGSRLAAVDLGSNSFRLEIARLKHGQLHRTEYLKETVRQGDGLNESHQLSEPAMQRGWDCLARFAEQLAGFHADHVRVVATQTLREAKNRDVFIARARSILGFPIDVISGREEARLIYQGVAHYLPQSNERRLVIDIGGRSSELILGQALQAQSMGSYRIGCVSWSMAYFANGELSETTFKRADIAAKAVLDEVAKLYAPSQWDVAYGSSGTMGAVGDLLEAAGWPAGVICLPGIEWLIDTLCKAGSIEKVKLLGLKEERRAVLAGGLSVLKALFELLHMTRLTVAHGALRHGALHDLLNRDVSGVDLRSASVARLVNQFQIDPKQAEQVSRSAHHLLATLLPTLAKLGHDGAHLQKKLNWAALLHEAGCIISHDGYHKHGAYILDHVEAPGFALHELHTLSLLVLGHKGKLKKLNDELNDNSFTAQLMCLRLAVIFCHARADFASNGVILNYAANHPRHFSLCLPNSWQTKLPQTIHLLEQEAHAWSKTDCLLSVTYTP